VQAVSRRSPHRPPRVCSVRQHLSAPAHGTRRGQIECGGSAGLSSTFQRHGIPHLLHYWSPSSFHFVPVCWQLRRACYPDFARAMTPRSVPSGFVQRTGCSACGLGYPHQVWWDPPMSHVHSRRALREPGARREYYITPHITDSPHAIIYYMLCACSRWPVAAAIWIAAITTTHKWGSAGGLTPAPAARSGNINKARMPDGCVACGRGRPGPCRWCRI
jgi:hypothetical protein